MNSNNQNSNPQFMVLKEKYFSSLPKKIQIMEDGIQQQNKESVGEQFHKLKGNGKTFGFSEISEIGIILDYHFKNKTVNYFHWAQIGVNLLNKIYLSYLNKEPLSLESIPEYSELSQSYPNSEKKGAS